MEDYRKYEPIFGSWYISKLIGQGSFGKVFEIVREEYGTRYKSALKIITIPQDRSDIKVRFTVRSDEESINAYYEDVLKDIVRENEIMAQLKGNSNIVSYEDHQIIRHDDGIGYDILIRMELLTSLVDRMAARRLYEKEVVQLGIDMCKALELCHSKNIIHRDIKPQNIFISDNGDYKLGDFGIARTIEKTTGGMSRTGTYNYMAPEVARAEHYNGTADIYSLGIVLYSLLNENRVPFMPLTGRVTPSDEEAARMKRFRGEPIPAPAHAGGDLARIILRACSFYPQDRYQTAEQMRRDLERYFAYYTGSFDRGAVGYERTVIENNPAERTGRITNPQVKRSTGYYKVKPPASGNAGKTRVKRKKKGRRGESPLTIAIVIALIVLLAAALIAMIVTKGDDDDSSESTEQSASYTSNPEYNGHHYKVINEGISWGDAVRRCESEGGHLATVNDAAEQDFIEDLLEKDGLQRCHYWLGGTDENSEGVWGWITGEPFSYAHWDPGDGRDHDPQPNNALDQDYMEIQTISNTGSNYMTWNDMCESGDNGANQGAPWYYMQQFFGYICEWDD